MGGIHLHPHDILDEGPTGIMKLVGKMGRIRYLLPEANTIFERNPYPAGILPHNPVHDVVQGTGTFHLSLDTRKLCPRLYQAADSSVEDGHDSLDLLLEAVKDTPYSVVPWVNLLNGHFEGDLQHNGVVDFRGNPSSIGCVLTGGTWWRCGRTCCWPRASDMAARHFCSTGSAFRTGRASK